MESGRLLNEAIPELAELRYDFDRREFVNTVTGKPAGQAAFNLLAQSRGAREAQAGSATLKRTVLVNSLVQGAGREVWRSILGELAEQGSPAGLSPLLPKRGSRRLVSGAGRDTWRCAGCCRPSESERVSTWGISPRPCSDSRYAETVLWSTPNSLAMVRSLPWERPAGGVGLVALWWRESVTRDAGIPPPPSSETLLLGVSAAKFRGKFPKGYSAATRRWAKWWNWPRR